MSFSVSIQLVNQVQSAVGAFFCEQPRAALLIIGSPGCCENRPFLFTINAPAVGFALLTNQTMADDVMTQ